MGKLRYVTKAIYVKKDSKHLNLNIMSYAQSLVYSMLHRFIVMFNCVQFYRRLTEEMTRRSWENTPVSQPITQAGLKVCLKLYSL